MKSTPKAQNSAFRVPIAGLLAWIVPGLGHYYVGDRGRGIIFMAAITVTFWCGIAIGGVKNTVNPSNRSLWFLGQACAGVHPLAALAWGRQIEIPDEANMTDWIAYGQTEDISVIYTAIAGMLNILIILDVLGRAERPVSAREQHAGSDSTTRRTTS